jgi:hypothetical protein
MSAIALACDPLCAERGRTAAYAVGLVRGRSIPLGLDPSIAHSLRRSSLHVLTVFIAWPIVWQLQGRARPRPGEGVLQQRACKHADRARHTSVPSQANRRVTHTECRSV